MRYFMFSYTANSRDGFAHGCVTMSCSVFPSLMEIKTAIGSTTKVIYIDSVVILNVYEFRNEAEFVNFRNK